MRKLIFLKIIVAVALLVAAAGTAIMLLWNWLMPEIFGLPEITFWQSLGLFLLAKILFGFHAGHKKSDSHTSWKKRWEKLPAERRELWKQRFTDKWCKVHGEGEPSKKPESI